MGAAGEAANTNHQQKKMADPAVRVPRPLLHPGARRSAGADSVHQAGARQRRAGLFRRGHPARGRPSAAPSGRPRPAGHAAAGGLRLVAQEQRGPRVLDHAGLRAAAGPAAEGSRHRQARGAHRARRIAHLRHGRHVPPGRHLFARGPAVHAAGRRPAQCLPRGPPGADPAGRHQRVRRHGILDRGRHGAQHAWAGDDPVLHLLFDVRLPARGRPGLGRRRHPRARFPPGRDLGPHHAGRRGPAARRRPQPRAGLGDPVVPRLRPGLCLRDRGDRAGRHAAHVPGTGRRLLLPDPDQRKDRASGHARRRRGRHPEGHASRARGRAG